MHVRTLSLTNFRNYATAELSLNTGVTVFVGRNGQGKTNLVESIGYLSSLSSHRVSQDSALIRAGADSAVIRARVVAQEREALLELQLNRSLPNRAQLNRAALRPRELLRHSSTVLFAPEDLALIKGEPGGRRRFLDQLLVLRIPRLGGVQADYDRVLRQRNSLLKSARGIGSRGSAVSTLDIWDERLVALGSEWIDARSTLVEELRPHVAAAYLAVAGADHRPTLEEVLAIEANDPEEEYAGRLDTSAPPNRQDTEAVFRAALDRVRRRELDRGLTLVGPHRDDVQLSLNGLPAKGYASHGESWSFALALKLAAGELLRAESVGGDPVLILDDVFAELDDTRRQRLAVAVSRYEQVLITAAVRADVPISATGGMITIAAGTVAAGNDDGQR